MSKIAVAAALGLFVLAGPASAQPAPPPGMAGMHVEMKAKMAEHRAQMDKDMHTILRLRPDQESAWRTLRDAMHPAGGPRHVMVDKAPGQTTLQHLEQMDKMAAEHQTRRAKVTAATRAFYTSLSAEQQAVFDALHRLRGPHGAPHGGPHRMGGHEGPGMFERKVIMHGGPQD